MNTYRKKQPYSIKTFLWIPATAFVIHSLLIFLFAKAIALKGPDADSGSMAWLLWLYVDFPLGFLGLHLSDIASTNTGAVLIVGLFGGIQWVIWGFLVALLLRRVLVRPT